MGALAPAVLRLIALIRTLVNKSRGALLVESGQSARGEIAKDRAWIFRKPRPQIDDWSTGRVAAARWVRGRLVSRYCFLSLDD